MGLHRQLPDQLRRLHPRYRTPWIGIIVFGVAAIVITLPGQAEFLGYLYAFGAMLSFTIAHLALIRLRISRPEIPRPYRAPGNVSWRGNVDRADAFALSILFVALGIVGNLPGGLLYASRGLPRAAS
jgi:amino acid transporter